MKWRYQIMKHKGKNCDDWYQIHEVYVEGKKLSWTQDGIVPHGDNKEDLIEMLEMMLKDAKALPVLDYQLTPTDKE